jgi:hypothetical protein
VVFDNGLASALFLGRWLSAVANSFRANSLSAQDLLHPKNLNYKAVHTQCAEQSCLNFRQGRCAQKRANFMTLKGCGGYEASLNALQFPNDENARLSGLALSSMSIFPTAHAGSWQKKSSYKSAALNVLIFFD